MDRAATGDQGAAAVGEVCDVCIERKHTRRTTQWAAWACGAHAPLLGGSYVRIATNRTSYHCTHNTASNYHYFNLLLKEGPNALLDQQYADRIVHHMCDQCLFAIIALHMCMQVVGHGGFSVEGAYQPVGHVDSSSTLYHVGKQAGADNGERGGWAHNVANMHISRYVCWCLGKALTVAYSYGTGNPSECRS